MLLLYPRTSILSNPVVMNHRAPGFKCFFDNYSVKGNMIFVDFFGRLAIDDIIVIDKIKIRAIQIAVRRMTAQHGPVFNMCKLVANAFDGILVYFVDTAPITCHFGGASHLHVLFDKFALSGDFIRPPIEAVKPIFYDFGINRLNL